MNLIESNKSVVKINALHEAVRIGNTLYSLGKKEEGLGLINHILFLVYSLGGRLQGQIVDNMTAHELAKMTQLPPDFVKTLDPKLRAMTIAERRFG